MSIEEEMDEARVPVDAQRQTILDYEGCEPVRAYIQEIGEMEPTGVNFILANVFKDSAARLTAHQARAMVWVFAKELILTGRKVKVMSPVNLAEMLCGVKPWEEEFPPDYADHLILTNFFRTGQPSPYTPKELNRLLDYIGERYEYGKTTHTFFELREANNIRNEASEWYPGLWLDWFLEENSLFWMGRR